MRPVSVADNEGGIEWEPGLTGKTTRCRLQPLLETPGRKIERSGGRIKQSPQPKRLAPGCLVRPKQAAENTGGIGL